MKAMTMKLTRDEVRNQMKTLARLKTAFLNRHAKELQTIQAHCPHEPEYQDDPAGGSDGYYLCRLCESWAYTREGLP